MSYPVFHVPSGDVLPVMFSTYASSTGASATCTGLAVTDIEIYKDGSTTQRSSDAGYTLLDTDGIDFDGITGIHGFSIDTGDNTDAGFYTVGAWFTVVVSAITVDSQTVSFIACQFRLMAAESIAAKPKVDVDAWLGTAAATPTVAGVPEVDLTHVAGATSDVSALATNVAAILVDTGTTLDGRIPAALVSGRMDVSVGAMAANVITASAMNADAITAAKVAADVGSEIASAVRTELATELGRIDAAVTTRASQTSVDTVDDFLDTEIAAIKAKTDSLTFTTANRVDSQVFGMEANTMTAAAAAADLSTEIRDKIVERTTVRCTVGAASSTTSIVTSACSPSGAVADQFKGRIVLFDHDTTTAALRGQATDITASSSAATPTLTVTAMTTAPASGDTFTIV